MLSLPAFRLLQRQPRIPHVARTVAERAIPNEHGTAITFIVKQGRSRKDWWIHATLDGHRMSNTLHTRDGRKAASWIRAVRLGQVRIVDGLELSTPAPTPEIPECAAVMGCLCAGHAGGNAPDTACDTRENRTDDEGCAGCLTASVKHPCRAHGCVEWCRKHYTRWPGGIDGPEEAEDPAIAALAIVDADEDSEECCAHCGSLDVDYVVWKRTGEVFGTFNQPDTVFCNSCEGGEDGDHRLISKGVEPEAFAAARVKWLLAQKEG